MTTGRTTDQIYADIHAVNEQLAQDLGVGLDAWLQLPPGHQADLSQQRGALWRELAQAARREHDPIQAANAAVLADLIDHETQQWQNDADIEAAPAQGAECTPTEADGCTPTEADGCTPAQLRECTPGRAAEDAWGADEW